MYNYYHIILDKCIAEPLLICYRIIRVCYIITRKGNSMSKFNGNGNYKIQYQYQWQFQYKIQCKCQVSI